VGVGIATTALDPAGGKVQLLYLDALDISQLNKADFIFSSHALELVPIAIEVVEPVWWRSGVGESGRSESSIKWPSTDVSPAVVFPIEHPKTPTFDDRMAAINARLNDREIKTFDEILAERGIDLNKLHERHQPTPFVQRADSLVQAMAAFDPPAANLTNITVPDQQDFQPALAANWR
jgi:hypothetical protein